MATNFTVVLRNRFRLSQQTLESLASSDNNEEVRITVLDDRSDNETRDFVRDWCRDNNATYIRNDLSIGTGTLRNMVIEEANKNRADYLALSDNDVYFYPNWLDHLVEAIDKTSEYGFAVIGGYGHPYHLPGDSFAVNDRYCVREVLALALQSWFMKWDVIDRWGPFSVTPPDAVCQGEDCDFGNKIREAGFKLGVISPPVLVNTGLTNSFGQKIPGYDIVKAQVPEGVYAE